MKIKKIVGRLILYGIAILILICTVITGPYFWNNWVTYPRLEKERSALWSKYKEPKKQIPQNEYKGVFHMHTYWSHDSRGTLDEILSAAKKANYNFLFISDHKRSKLDTFPRSYHGVYDDIVFEAGTESSTGLMITPMRNTVVDWDMDESELIHDLVVNGGLVNYVHTEDSHNWDNPDYQSMEIYNIHTDYLDGNDSRTSVLLNLAINSSKYHHWVFRDMYDEQIDIISNWDALNKKRRIVGVAGVDAHNNQSYRARYTSAGKVEWVGPNAKTIDIVELGLKEAILLREPDEFGWAFKFEVDPYFISFNHVANHVFSDTLTNIGIKDNMIAGHAFISFQSLAKADGFQYFTIDTSSSVNAILGDSVSAETISIIKAVSPYPVKFELLKDGDLIYSEENVYQFEYDPNRVAGNYRVVAKLFLDDQWISWVFTNPIYAY